MTPSCRPSLSPRASTHSLRAARSMTLTEGSSVSRCSIFMVRDMSFAALWPGGLTSRIGLRQCSVKQLYTFHNAERFKKRFAGQGRNGREFSMKLTRRVLMRSAAAIVAAPAVGLFPTGARAAEFNFKYGNQVPATHPVTIGFQRAVDRIKAETGGRVEINMFPNNALGGDTDMLSQLRSGALEFFTISPLVLSSLVSVAAINGLGFAFKDSDTAWAAMDGDLGEFVRREIRQRGLTAMEKIWDSGYRQITSNSKPIN